MLSGSVWVSRSPSSRRAWIEIGHAERCPEDRHVALLAEGVDRNRLCDVLSTQSTEVALLAEGVDRNYIASELVTDEKRVALLAEGVDRNSLYRDMGKNRTGRPPRGGRG